MLGIFEFQFEDFSNKSPKKIEQNKRIRIFEHSRKRKIAFLLSAFKKKGFKSCATIVTGGTSISSAPDLSAERMKHRRRRDGLGEG